MASLIINNEEITCESYVSTSTSLTIYGMVTDNGVVNLTLNGVNWNNVILQEPSNEPTLEERVETNEDALDELIQYVYGGA